eukprot:268152_1
MDHKHDLSPFKNKDNTHAAECNTKSSYTECSAMKRLLTALKYYSMLDIIDKVEDREFFRKFMNDIYYQVLDDYIHFNNHHSHELETINASLVNNSACQILSCSFTCRHHGEATKTNNLDHIMDFYIQTMDSLHFYLFHCYDVGIRTQKQNATQDEEEENKQDQYFDAAFSRINKTISHRASTTHNFDRFSNKKNTKFNIKTEQKEQTENNVGDNTYLDAIYEYLQSKNVKKNDIAQLNKFIQDEEYDTDAIAYDVHLSSFS